MKKIKRKVYKDIQIRSNFYSNELSKRELLCIRKAPQLMGTETWKNAIDHLNNKGDLGSITLIRNLCINTGRARGVLVPFGLSRMEWRRFADKGEIPGFRRASW